MTDAELAQLDREITEVRREVEMRRRVYPGFVGRGAMTQGEADARLATMQAVRNRLVALRAAAHAARAPGLPL